MTVKKNVAKTKERVTQVFNQARESLKLLETLEKETLAKAKSFVKNPMPDAKAQTNEKIASSLRKLGVATQSEVDFLRSRIEKLEALLAEKESAGKRGNGKSAIESEEALPRT